MRLINLQQHTINTKAPARNAVYIALLPVLAALTLSACQSTGTPQSTQQTLATATPAPTSTAQEAALNNFLVSPSNMTSANSLQVPAKTSSVMKITAPAPGEALVGRWKLESAISDNAAINSMGVKTLGFAILQPDGTGQLDMTVKLGFISRARKAEFTWKREGSDLQVHESTKDHPTTWKLLSMTDKRMEAEVPSGRQKLRMVFVREL